MRNLKRFHGRHRYSCKSFVDFEEIDLVYIKTSFIKRLFNGLNWSRCEPSWILSVTCKAYDFKFRYICKLLSPKNYSSCPIVNGRSVSSSDCSVLIESRS